MATSTVKIEITDLEPVKQKLIQANEIIDAARSLLTKYRENADKIDDWAALERALDASEEGQATTKFKRLELKEGREHLTVTNEFQSDKYPWCPAGFVPLKMTDPMAIAVLRKYAYLRRTIDFEFSRDLHDALDHATRAEQKQSDIGKL